MVDLTVRQQLNDVIKSQVLVFQGSCLCSVGRCRAGGCSHSPQGSTSSKEEQNSSGGLHTVYTELPNAGLRHKNLCQLPSAAFEQTPLTRAWPHEGPTVAPRSRVLVFFKLGGEQERKTIPKATADELWELCPSLSTTARPLAKHPGHRWLGLPLDSDCSLT